MTPRMRSIVLVGLLLVLSLGVAASEPDLQIRVVQKTPDLADPMSVKHLALRDGAVCLADKVGHCLSVSIAVAEDDSKPGHSNVQLVRDERNRVISAEYHGFTYLVTVFEDHDPEAAAALKSAINWIITDDSPHRKPIGVVLADLASMGYAPSQFRIMTDGRDVTSFAVSLSR